MFEQLRNPVPKTVTAKPGSPEWWDDSRRFWAEMRCFWLKQAKRQRYIGVAWLLVAALLALSAVLNIIG